MAPNANTELLRDDSLFDCGSKIAREGFATMACVEVFSIDWTGIGGPCGDRLDFVQWGE